MKLLLVTNDFPPRVGGIQRYIRAIYGRLARDGVDVRVLAPAYPGDREFDRALEMEVLRWPGPIYWPTNELTHRVAQLSSDVDAVCFGAVLPMNLVAMRIDRPVVVHTHGFEVAWARLPGLRVLLGKIAARAALVTAVSRFTHRALSPAMGAGTAFEMLPTGVDLDRFHPSVEGSAVRARHGLTDRRVIACVSRLVPRKGQDELIRALPAVRARIPDVALLIVGDGPARARLRELADAGGAAEQVVFTGEVPEAQLPEHYAAGDLFAMPCRSRFAGLEVEGLGLVYLEAQACGRPAVAGESGGAPEAVLDGDTGRVVDGRRTDLLASTLADLLSDRARLKAMGAAGRAFVEREHDWDAIAAGFRDRLRKL